MLFPADHLLKSALREINQLQTTATGTAEGSALQSLGVALRLLIARETGGIGAVNEQLQRMADCLSHIESGLLPNKSFAPQFDHIRESIARARSGLTADRCEAVWRELVAEAQAMMQTIAGSSDLDATSRKQVTQAFIAWECVDLQAQLGTHATTNADRIDTEITQTRWRDYLRDRFNEPELQVTAFRSLAGGFGKQTYLFDVKGVALNGAYVLRRDLAVTLFDNDCHRIEKEHALICAVFKRGFPAPDVVWLDTEHRLLPGGHFLVMRRSPGIAGGSIFGANGKVPHDLAETLAGILARLHALPALAEVGALTESISPELWQQPMREVVQRYLLNWRDLFLREAHLPSPAIIGLFGWLLEHIPQMSGRPALLHGDIGFHNFLFDEGKLQAVLDWEFGHIGDPAEDLAYVRNTLGAALDWDAFISTYRKAGGCEVTAERLHFFQVWGHVRNACASNLVSAKLYSRQIDDLKVIILPHAYIPQFLQAAQALIQELPLSQ